MGSISALALSVPVLAVELSIRGRPVRHTGETPQWAGHDSKEQTMSQYLLSIYQPDGPTPPPAELERIGRELEALREEMRATGAWVFSGGLQAAQDATVVRDRRGEIVSTDGPFVEAKEHLGGFTILTAPDRDAAIAWARKLARVTTLPIEVRAFRK
jgi:hypothetical protein